MVKLTLFSNKISAVMKKTTVFQVMSNVTSEAYVSYIRSRVPLSHTKPLAYYNSAYRQPEDHGTAHVSVMTSEGAAVAVTTSINE